jgi:hypothetical protein
VEVTGWIPGKIGFGQRLVNHRSQERHLFRHVGPIALGHKFRLVRLLVDLLQHETTLDCASFLPECHFPQR